MPKRSAEEPLRNRSSKRRREEHDRLSSLSDELLLRILIHVPLSTLTTFQRVSQRFNRIAGDSQIWREFYYARFVQPRARRVLGIRNRVNAAPTARLWKTFDEGEAWRKTAGTDWKRQYKIRHNWSRGSCDVSEISLADRPPMPALLAKLHHSVVYTVDVNSGIRAWSYKNEGKMLASRSLEQSQLTTQSNIPTSLALDQQQEPADMQRFAIGFRDGSFAIYAYEHSSCSFSLLYAHPASSRGLVSAIAFSTPYLLTMTDAQTLSVYEFDIPAVDMPILPPPRLLSSLQSHTCWPPLSLALRITSSIIIASVAFCVPTYSSGWSAGVQELHLSLDGTILQSRLASAINQKFTPIRDPAISAQPLSTQTFTKPTSLSYSHPYLLVSHADNTLTLYLVHSSDDTFDVSPGRRLWGHTSSVFGAHIGGRGKAVSVSACGGEVRIWELEGSTGRTRGNQDGQSVQLTPERRKDVSMAEALQQRGNGLGLALDRDQALDGVVTSAWVGFDEENVIVVRERGRASQALAVYDFT